MSERPDLNELRKKLDGRKASGFFLRLRRRQVFLSAPRS